MNSPRLETAIADLERAGLDVTSLREQLRARAALAERAVPTEDDTRWPLLAPIGIEEHLKGETRPVLSCAIEKGRMYALSVAQRAVLREWFNMIPSPEVEVVELNVFDGQPIRLVRELVLKTTVHKPHGALTLSPRLVTISTFGKFMSACAAREVETAQQQELRKLIARVERLLKRADEDGVSHGQRGPGTVANLWHSDVELNKLVEPEHVRESLRVILLQRGEQGLAKLVKEPFVVGDRAARVEEEYAEFMKALGV